MYTIEASNEASRPWPRLRFSLKALLVLVTLVGLWLGWKTARERRAAEMVARHHSMLDLIENNMATAPTGTSFRFSPAQRQRTAAFRKRTRPNQAEQRQNLGGMFENGRFRNTVTRTVILDVSQAAVDRDTLTSRIRAHYEQGLDELGLRRIVDLGGHRATGIWTLPDENLNVIIDVVIESDDAQVRTIYLYNDRLSIW